LKRGFTLIEVLLALVLVSVMALLAWRGIAGMGMALTQTADHEQKAQRLRMALAQWSADLDAQTDTGVVKALDFDGQSLRLTRRSHEPSGISVVAWVIQSGRLLRYAAPPAKDKATLQQDYAAAIRWAKTPLPEDMPRTADLVAASSWQIFYYRSDAWTNALSSAGSNPTQASAAAQEAQPDGVRLVLNLSPNADPSGRYTRDWVQPSLGATR
jgi:general secretion pathway protein J